MAKHKVDISARAPRMKVSRTANGRALDAGEQDGADEGVAGVTGIQHKPKLSVAVLKAVGLYGGAVPAKDSDNTDAEARFANARARELHAAQGGKAGAAAHRDLRDSDGAIFLPAPESADQCSTVADVVALLSAQYGGYFERTPIQTDDGELTTVKFTYGETADVVTGSGKTTKEAVRNMAAKLDESFACLEDSKRASRSADSEGDDNE